MKAIRFPLSSQASLVFFVFFLAGSLALSSPLAAKDKWSGVDETVVERIAAEEGREAKDPLLNTDQGDLLLFLFLVSGAVAGFFAGYYWRVLITPASPGRVEGKL